MSTEPRSVSTDKVGATRIFGLSPGLSGEGHACPVSMTFAEKTGEVA